MAFVWVSVACHGADPSADELGTDPGNADSSSTLTLLTLGASARHVTQAVNLPLQHLVFLPLFHGYHTGAGGTDDMPDMVEGRLVRRVEALPDGVTWRYYMRTDVRWHDGVPVTARDIKFTFDLYGPHAWAQRDGSRATVVVEDDSTFTITFHYRAEPFDTYTTFLPAHLLADLDPGEIDEWDFWDRPVGNGPYRFVREESAAFVVLEANQDYYRGPPAIERVILRLAGGSTEMAWLELQAGNADAANWNLGQGGKFSELAARDSDYVVYTAPFATVHTIVWNLRHPLFADVRVRRALALAVNRAELREFLYKPPDFPLHDGPITEGLLRAGEFVPAPPHLPDSARSLLGLAGWGDTDGDGLLDRDGDPFRFELLIRGSPSQFPGLMVVREQLRRVGVQMELRGVPPQTHDERIWAGEFEAVMGGLDLPSFAHDTSANGHPHRRRCCRRNGYSNPEVMTLDSILVNRVWPPEDSVYRRWGEIFRRDRPALTLELGERHMLAHRRVRGLSGETVYIASHMEELWLDEPN
jgi:peptide/nickel transport system substrate-binding protein